MAKKSVADLLVDTHRVAGVIGSGDFRETHPEHLLRECSHYCELVAHPEQMPRGLEIAVQTAVSRRGVSVVVLPGDIALACRCEPAAPQISDTDAECSSFR